ncbi:hypothetical protein [Noviluteimonas gilva]|uniref:Uncharacterized protein n=1 Tax=Noviluteimonas gilva TaxID=2682097 RepID=A0A7C9HUI7_9GAMM|nr:hypothetical protein [Lysobacter gilvus]MUV15353.1 hypothetical protein [Lysobacter gilvus]
MAFPVRQLRSPIAVWLNSRWFLSHGFDVRESGARQQVEAWLIRRFAFAVFEEGVDARAFSSEASVFHAERYGATGLSPNGGGGRAGIAHGFCVKGIGRTPLVGKRADWQHANGHLLIEEALREAIWSEIMERRRPGSAVPTIAVLDTGIFADPVDPRTRRALLVRPFEARLAHFERATFFEPLASMPRAQVIDAERTALAVNKFASTENAARKGLRSAFAALAGHIAYGHVHRLFHGGLYSANATTRGLLLDFGSTRQLADWSPASFTDNGVRFGEEMKQLRDILRSLAYYFRKYGAIEDGDALQRNVWQAALRAYATTVASETLDVFGLKSESEASLRRSALHFARSQFRVQQGRNRHAMPPDGACSTRLQEHVALARQALANRPLTRERVQGRLHEALDHAGSGGDPRAPEMLDELAESLISAGLPMPAEEPRVA